ncbi:SH3 domain-containing protein [Affinibrenneria salicis]|uniref:SH3 domain-containing protein n=1 Tax=Affinibrenneria salicis TaxID=2590031 RepID=A0A5J5FWJ7_9GAMM|nr:SH3 domain-containing protein [Affinibrenneria salicis]KAA8998152.1 SH3 domain-containing protein [Affinibrenneria salicis]
MKIRIALILLALSSLAGCTTPPPPPVSDDTIITTEVDGSVLTHRHAIQPPAAFSPVNEQYRALYAASVMTKPSYDGELVRYLENGQPFTVRGVVENEWLAIAETGKDQILGYVPPKAGVNSSKYEETLRKDRPRPRVRAAATNAAAAQKKTTCVSTGDGKVCRDNNSATWVLE